MQRIFGLSIAVPAKGGSTGLTSIADINSGLYSVEAEQDLPSRVRIVIEL